DRHRARRRADPRAPQVVHDRDRDSQHAASRARREFHGLLLPGQAGRARPHRRYFHTAKGAAHRRLHYRSLRLRAKGMDRRHTDREYEGELEGLKERVLLMGARVEELITLAMRSYSERSDELAQSTIDLDRHIDQLELDIDERAIQIL